MKSTIVPAYMAKIDLHDGWVPFAGLTGIEFKPLADNLDETARTGSRTRLVRFAPGAFTTQVLQHTYWEEFLLMSGDMFDLTAQRRHEATAFSRRPPGTLHGPYSSRDGCVALETQYYAA